MKPAGTVSTRMINSKITTCVWRWSPVMLLPCRGGRHLMEEASTWRTVTHGLRASLSYSCPVRNMLKSNILSDLYAPLLPLTYYACSVNCKLSALRCGLLAVDIGSSSTLFSSRDSGYGFICKCQECQCLVTVGILSAFWAVGPNSSIPSSFYISTLAWEKPSWRTQTLPFTLEGGGDVIDPGMFLGSTCPLAFLGKSLFYHCLELGLVTPLFSFSLAFLRFLCLVLFLLAGGLLCASV